MRGERDAPVRAGVDAGFETGESSPEFFECAGAAARKTRFFPYFVKTARVTGVAALQVDRTDTQPARDPNIDGVILGQRTTCDGRGRLD
jgi:hypothetical protein